MIHGETQLTGNEQIAQYLSGAYEATDFKTQCAAGWFDWFCSDKALPAKTHKLYKYLLGISKSSKLDLNNSYVFFKNTCPMVGNLYDDFRICDMKSGDVIFTITPKSGFKSDDGTGTVYGKENGFEAPLFKGTWKEIKNWFNS